MVRCANRETESYLTYGEFCVIATELRYLCKLNAQNETNSRTLWNRAKRSASLSSASAPPITAPALRKRRDSRPRFEVFLGGSCNPTTWRRDYAIPILQKSHLTFYNPQVDEWYPELMEIEAQAKDSASLLFFVVDNQTRGIASMIEVAYLSGIGRELILVTNDFPAEAMIDGAFISAAEICDLNDGHCLLRDIVERKGVPVFSDTRIALECTVKVLRHGVPIENLGAEDGARPVTHSRFAVGELLLKVKETFNLYDSDGSGELDVDEMLVALKSMDATMTSEACAKLLKMYDLDNSGHLSFEEFCCMVSEMGQSGNPFEGLLTVEGTMSSDFSGIQPGLYCREVFLGGSCASTSWRQDTAIPLLRSAGVTFFNPQVERWSASFMSIEARAKQECKTLLFVIDGETRAIVPMIEAAYYIGQRRNVILVVHQIAETASIGTETLIPRALRDYNRGRMYLADLANRSGVPVFTEVDDAVRSILQRTSSQQQKTYA
eukprot:Opistho-2@22041